MPAPTRVTLADGTSYSIPAGDQGTYPWVRQASLIAVAYKQLGDLTRATEWDAEYARRAIVWNEIQRGRDRSEVLRQFGSDLLLAPLRIAATIGNAAIDTAAAVKGTVFKLADLLTNPLFLLGVAVVAVLVFSPVGARVVRRVSARV